MRTIIICHTDWSGPEPQWVRQPFLDGGRLRFMRDYPPDWAQIFDDLGRVARVDAVAIGCRGTYDPPAVACLPIARAAWNAAKHKPKLTFWADTVGLPDITHELDGSPFNFALNQHIEWAIEHFFSHFFVNFMDADLEIFQGDLVLPWWGLAPPPGSWGWKNEEQAQRLLDAVTSYVVGLHIPGVSGVKHIVDHQWFEKDRNLRVFGAHAWFNPWTTPPSSYSTYTHHFTTCGAVVPGFSDPNHPLPEKIPSGADTARRGLKACRDANCVYIILEGATDFVEGAEWLRSQSGDPSKLEAIREHQDIVNPPQPPQHGDARMDLAITQNPLLTWKTGVLVPVGEAKDTFALRWTQPADAPGYPDPHSTKFLCLNPDGKTEAKDQIGEWETSQKVKAGDREIQWWTFNDERTQSALMVFGFQAHD